MVSLGKGHQKVNRALPSWQHITIATTVYSLSKARNPDGELREKRKILKVLMIKVNLIILVGKLGHYNSRQQVLIKYLKSVQEMLITRWLMVRSKWVSKKIKVVCLHWKRNGLKCCARLFKLWWLQMATTLHLTFDLYNDTIKIKMSLVWCRGEVVKEFNHHWWV